MAVQMMFQCITVQMFIQMGELNAGVVLYENCARHRSYYR